jgi:predicted secreted Zn-dependent protease
MCIPLNDSGTYRGGKPAEGVDCMYEAKDLTWRTSGRCGTGACVEVAQDVKAIYLRDSKDPAALLAFSHEEWKSFVAGVKAGEFDLLPE